jgi:high-affinity nickel-transport protein
MITIIVAIIIGTIQLLSLVRNVANPEGGFWDGVEVIEDYYDVIGASICASFIIFGGLSVLLYKPWRAYVDKRVANSHANSEEERLLSPPVEGDADMSR